MLVVTKFSSGRPVPGAVDFARAGGWLAGYHCSGTGLDWVEPVVKRHSGAVLC